MRRRRDFLGRAAPRDGTCPDEREARLDIGDFACSSVVDTNGRLSLRLHNLARISQERRNYERTGSSRQELDVMMG